MADAQTVTATSSAQATQPNADAGKAPATAPAADPKAQASPETPKPEVKAEGKPAAEAPKAEPSKPSEAEVKYELKLSEGSLLGDADVASAVEFAKANKIAPEVAAKILEQREQTVKGFQAAKEAEWKRVTQEVWKGELASDPEIGGDKLPGALEDSKRLVQTFMDKELQEYVERMGYLNNKHFVRFLSRLGAQRRDDKIVTGTTSAATEKSRLDIMYPMAELQNVQG